MISTATRTFYRLSSVLIVNIRIEIERVDFYRKSGELGSARNRFCEGSLAISIPIKVA